jgi:hypothetical protein
MRAAWAVPLCIAAFALSACGEKPQTLRKADSKSWDAAQNAYVDPGWKPGDQASWEEQMRNRAQYGQNEYQRSPAVPK